MKEIFSSRTRSIFLYTMLVILSPTAISQGVIPEELSKIPAREQLNYIEEHTRIYENFRAIREDIFQKLKKNISDTLSSTNKKIAELNGRTLMLNETIDSLNTSLNTTRADLERITQTKDSISFLGMEVNKNSYNTIMWSTILILLLLLLTGFMIFKRNQKIVVNRNKDLQELRDEFEAYRKTSREAREKMSLQHFNELKKLRGE